MSALVQLIINNALSTVDSIKLNLQDDTTVVKARAEDLVNDSALMLEHMILGIKTPAEIAELQALLRARTDALVAVSSMAVVGAVNEAVSAAIRGVITGSIR